jgi:hypothetical protein
MADKFKFGRYVADIIGKWRINVGMKPLHRTLHIHNGGESAKIETNMNKLTDIAIINSSAGNTATVHMRNRCG